MAGGRCVLSGGPSSIWTDLSSGAFGRLTHAGDTACSQRVLSSEASSVGQVTGCALGEPGLACGAPGAGWWGARPEAPWAAPCPLCCSHLGAPAACRGTGGHAVLSARDGAPLGRGWRRVHRTPAGHKGPQAPDPGTQLGVPCRASRQPRGMRGLERPRTGFRGSGVRRAEGGREARRARGGLSSQQGRSEGGARRGGVPTAGTTPRGRQPGRGTRGGTPRDAHLSPSSPCSGVALSPICSQAHHILHVSEGRPSQGDLRGRPASAPPAAPASRPWRVSQPLRLHGPWGLGSAAIRRPGHHPSETKPRMAGRSLASAVKFP